MNVQTMITLLESYPKDMEVIVETEEGNLMEDLAIDAGFGQVVIKGF